MARSNYSQIVPSQTLLRQSSSRFSFQRIQKNYLSIHSHVDIYAWCPSLHLFAARLTAVNRVLQFFLRTCGRSVHALVVEANVPHSNLGRYKYTAGSGSRWSEGITSNRLARGCPYRGTQRVPGETALNLTQKQQDRSQRDIFIMFPSPCAMCIWIYTLTLADPTQLRLQRGIPFCMGTVFVLIAVPLFVIAVCLCIFHRRRCCAQVRRRRVVTLHSCCLCLLLLLSAIGALRITRITYVLWWHRCLGGGPENWRKTIVDGRAGNDEF